MKEYIDRNDGLVIENPSGPNYSASSYYTVYVLGWNSDDSTPEAVSGAIVKFYRQKSSSSSEYEYTTGLDGKVTYSRPFSGAPSRYYVTVSASGYRDVTLDEEVCVEEFDSINITLRSINTTAYYVIHVQSLSTGESINDATVKVYASSSDGGSTSATKDLGDGDYIYTYIVNGSGGTYPPGLYFEVIANGYKTPTSRTYVSAKTSVVEARSSKPTVKLEKGSYSNYYYHLSVLDSDNNPVPNATVRLYSDFSFTSTYGVRSVSLSYDVQLNSIGSNRDNVIRVVNAFTGFKNGVPSLVDSCPCILLYGLDEDTANSFLSALTSVGASATRIEDSYYELNNEIFYTLREIIYNVTGKNTSSAKLHTTLYEIGIDSLDAVTIMNAVSQKYSIDFTITSLDNTFQDLVNFVRDDAINLRSTKKSIYTTNTDGEIHISLGQLSSAPSPIYVKGVNLPNEDLEWGSQNSGQLTASTSSTHGGKLILRCSEYTYESKTYYHNYHIIDKYTNTPISGCVVKYSYNNNVIFEKTTGDDGNSNIGCNYDNVYVTISKDGYESFGFNSVGNEENDSYISIKLKPKNSIRVVYQSDVEGGEQIPAEGVTLRIFKYDDNGSVLKIDDCNTYSTGYIKTLSNSLYTASVNQRIFIRVIGKTVVNGEQIKNLTTGNIVITISKNSNNDIDESINELEYFNNSSINSIKKKIDIGNMKLNGTSMTYTNEVSYNSDDFRIEISDPDSITTYDIFTSKPVIVDNNHRKVIGSVDIDVKPDVNDLRLRIINRYSGYYNPIFKDILFYKNFNDSPFSNTEFDVTYKDNQGKFGYINNMWFHKVNDENAEIITSLTPYYPLIGQYALSIKDYNIFSSNWDTNYYTKQLDIDNYKDCQNIVSMKNGLCMFGSKYLNVPETIEINGFNIDDNSNWNGEWNDDWITLPEACPGEIMFKEINDNSVSFYLFIKKRILRYFVDKLKDEFSKYISKKNSFGKEGIEDDIEEYVTKNVLKLYKLEHIRFFVRRTKMGQHNSKINNDYTSFSGDYVKNPETGEYIKEYKRDPETGGLYESKVSADTEYFRKHGFVEITNITMTKMNRDDFDRKIVYNLRRGSREEFGFSFILKKI